MQHFLTMLIAAEPASSSDVTAAVWAASAALGAALVAAIASIVSAVLAKRTSQQTSGAALFQLTHTEFVAWQEKKRATYKALFAAARDRKNGQGDERTYQSAVDEAAIVAYPTLTRELLDKRDAPEQIEGLFELAKEDAEMTPTKHRQKYGL